MYRKLCTTLLVVTVALVPVCAQVQQDSSAVQAKQAEDQALRQKAFELLESLAGELGTMRSAENRARIGSNIAGSLWPHNENRARALFAGVQEDINLGLQTPESQSPEDIKTLMVFLKLRADTTERIAKYDPEFAYEFFKATVLSREKKLPEYVRESEKTLEAHLAKQLSSSNPDLSLELARKMLAQGFTDDLQLLLARLNRKHKAKATVLYKEIVRKLGDVNLVEDWSVRNFALTLVTTFGPPAADEATFRELVNLFIKVMAQNGCTTKLEDEDERAFLCRQLAPVISSIAKVDPSRVTKLQRWAEGSYGYTHPYPYYELNDLSNDGSVDDILALIEQYPHSEFDIRFKAVQKAQRDGDPERARKILAEYTSDPQRQRALSAQFEQMQARVSFTNEQLEEAQKHLSELQNAGKQVTFLSALANQVGNNDRKTALKLLNQAAEIMETMKPGRDQTSAEILLAILYSHEKNNRGLAMMESLVPKLNELVASAAKLDGYDTRYLRDGEWNMTAEGELGSLLTALAQHAGYFAWFDFDRAVSVAGQFERPEIRMMAQLKLAQGILAGPPKRGQLSTGGIQPWRN